MKRPAVIAMRPADLGLAERIAGAIDGSVESFLPRVPEDPNGFDNIAGHLRVLFTDEVPIVAIMAAGAVIRLLAPLLADKCVEPPVLAVARDASSVVPLLGGHHGANNLARRIAVAISGHAAITTAGELGLGIALDEPPQGYRLANPAQAKQAMAALLGGAQARLEGEADWIQRSGLTFNDNGGILLQVTDSVSHNLDKGLVYHPTTLVLGMGCERGAPLDEAIALAEQTLAEGGYARQSLACVASLDLKADEPAIHAVAAHFGVPARFFDAERLERETPRLSDPSELVFAAVGCHGVAEGAALAGVGPDGGLATAKRKSRRVTAAIARARQPLTAQPGRSRGKLSVVGIGPGQEVWRSPEATRIIRAADDLVGYSLYLDLIAMAGGAGRRHPFPLGREEDRVRHAMEIAGEGRNVALICSGDAGIYAMATLVFELLEQGGLSAAATRITIEVAPGISAMQAAAARAGAPLGHDFCAISLSDLLTPWSDIEKRLRAAAMGDFVIAFYNPVSQKRRTQLARARQILLEHRDPNTPVILASNLGRDGEALRITQLVAMNIADVDMLTTVIVGSTRSRTISTGDNRIWVYTPRGYAEKEERKAAGAAGGAPSGEEAIQ
jgi:cobalt-precorrin 5A hydrolase / precorrin-3B C17-methyltransferase